MMFVFSVSFKLCLVCKLCTLAEGLCLACCVPVDWYIMFNSVSQNHIVAKGRVHWRNKLHSE